MIFFLVGYYGYGNVGDDICLIKTKEIILNVYPNSSFYILSKGVIDDYSVNRWNLFSIIYTMFRSDQIVFGGGGLLQNKTSFKSLYYYLLFGA